MDLHYEAMSGLMDNPCLFSTIRAGLIDLETGEVVDALYDEAGQYCEAISNSLDTFQTDEYPANDLMLYLHWDQPQMEAEIRSKVRSAHITVETSGKVLYAKLELDLVKDLTAAELDAFTEQVACQYRDGWGAQFELVNIPVSDHAVCLRLWHDEISFFTGEVKARLQHRGRQKAKGSHSKAKSSAKAKRQAER